ncbi:dihydroorotase [Nitrospirota bacterium]
MKILIKNGHVIDPSQKIDGKFDILIENKTITKVRKAGAIKARDNFKVIDATGLYVLPGLVDMHVHLREPGFAHKETIETGTKAAIRGGVTTVCCMPNTSPVNDNPGIAEYIIQKAQKEGVCTVYPVGAISKGQEGKELAELGLMMEEGCVAFSDDGHPVDSPMLMRRALEYSRSFDLCIISHAEEPSLSGQGVMNEGLLARSLGLEGIPNAAEDTMVFRDVALAELTKGKLHIAHVSTEGAVRIIRDAKARGINVTAETCPHYFSITEDEVAGFNTNAKVNPPLRTEADRLAIRQGIKDGTLDVIVTDHAPHHLNEKGREFDAAPPGISGLETSLSLSLALVREKVIDMSTLVRMMAQRPAEILGLDKGTLKEGADADVVLVDVEEEYKVDPEEFFSKGKNTPFEGWQLRGRAAVTISGGKVHEWR